MGACWLLSGWTDLLGNTNLWMENNEHGGLRWFNHQQTGISWDLHGIYMGFTWDLQHGIYMGFSGTYSPTDQHSYGKWPFCR